MASRHATAATRFDARGAVAFGDVGGSGLIVVVIVAAWALFLVPQWMHKRASAAAHLADRIPGSDGVEVDLDAPEAGAHADPDSTTARASRRFGRRSIARTRTGDDTSARWARWRLPSMLRARRRPSSDSSVEAAERVTAPPVSAAARRRRILATLALATLVTAVAVAVAGVLGASAPTWLVAVPGGLMVAYLAVLAVVRPGAPERRASAQAAPDASAAARLAPTLSAGPAPAEPLVEKRHGEALEPVSTVPTDPPAVPESVQPDAQDDTWTPVPLPTPTYVTAPRARRSVRTIDLSNPGSWTTAAPASTAPAASSAEVEENDDYLVEHRRAVGD